MPSHQVAEPTDLGTRCEMLRSLHVPGAPLVLPNAWDAATARAVVAAGFAVVATTSGGVAASLGYEDHERAPGDEMLAAAGRIAAAVDVPVTVDAEAGYGMEPDDLVARLKEMGAAGCNLEDTDHATGELRDPAEQAARLRAVRAAACEQAYGLVINARIDVFLSAFLAGDQGKSQAELVTEALQRAHVYVEAGADCVFPIVLWEPDALDSFLSDAPGPVNVVQFPRAPSHAKLAELGVARISYGHLLHHNAIEQFGRVLESIPGTMPDAQPRPRTHKRRRDVILVDAPLRKPTGNVDRLHLLTTATTPTAREHEVLALLTEGLTDRGIGEHLWLTRKTVETHIRHILAKLNVPNGPRHNRRVLAAVAYLSIERDPDGVSTAAEAP